MQPTRYYYLIKLQYLGFRYHGWQRQPQLKTVEHMVHRTTNYVFKKILKRSSEFKILAAGRTDAMVSVNGTYVELFVNDEPLDLEEFFPLFNRNLPQDIRALEITETDADFNIIQHPQIKEYLYFFNFGQKHHPFCAPFMVNIVEELNLASMRKAAKLFEGKHDLRSYVYRPSPQTQTEGEILTCKILENDLLTANFFPEKSYFLKIRAAGFKRHQIRLIMGGLIQLGKGEVDLDFIEKSLKPENNIVMTYIAPASGLILNSVEFLEMESEI
ncbi:MAG TPA: hypothetical protein VK021_12490 [Flavobacteriaceae bacterium]|nr:hypothetical protein [Flavobacteriaceae bacterium]